MITYQLNLSESGRPYPHYWEMCVGSCHAATVLRADVQAHLRRAHEECGFRYLRFHGLFDDDMSVYITNPLTGAATVSFYNVDLIFDFLLSIGMKPFVEIAFMPEGLASGDETLFHYKNNITMPADDEKWTDLIRRFGEHLLARYGAPEISTWFFEVWNEPNLRAFFKGSQRDYFHLYEMTARTLKTVSPIFRVGGPATSNNMWIPQFIAYCEGCQVPLDFITTHHYPSDDPLSTAGMNGEDTVGLGFRELFAELMKLPEEDRTLKLGMMLGHAENTNPRDVLYQTAKKAKEESGNYPLYYTEWNTSHDFDNNYCATAVIHTLASNENLVEGYSYWTVSDIFEEMGLLGKPFNNAFGMLTIHGIPKPVYRVFQALHQAGDRRLNVQGAPHRTAELLALSDGNAVTVFAYNHDLDSRNIQAEDISLVLEGVPASISKAVIDAANTAPVEAWKVMGSPDYLNSQQVQALEQASELVFEPLPAEQVIRLTLAPESVTILKIVR